MVFRLRELSAGEYLGTVVQGEWGRRDESQRLQETGTGEWMVDEFGLLFFRKDVRIPIVIPYTDMLDVHEAAWHGKQSGPVGRVVKIVWVKGSFESTMPRATDHLELASGFMLSSDSDETQFIIEHLQRNVRRNLREGTNWPGAAG